MRMTGPLKNWQHMLTNGLSCLFVNWAHIDNVEELVLDTELNKP